MRGEIEIDRVGDFREPNSLYKCFHTPHYILAQPDCQQLFLPTCKIRQLWDSRTRKNEYYFLNLSNIRADIWYNPPSGICCGFLGTLSGLGNLEIKPGFCVVRCSSDFLNKENETRVVYFQIIFYYMSKTTI